MAYQIAICDDELVFCTTIENYLNTYQNETGREFHINQYHSGEELLADKTNGRFFHLLFLDIELVNENGMEIAKKIRETDRQVIIIFATIHKNFALQAYDVDAIGYLVKPVIYDKLKSIMDKSFITIDFLIERSNQSQNYLPIKILSNMVHLPYDDIIFMEKIINRIDIHTEKETYSTYEAFKSLKARIDSHKFPQIHQGYIVNFEKIKEMTANGLYVTVKKEAVFIPVSRRYYSRLLKRYKDESIKVIYRKRMIYK